MSILDLARRVPQFDAVAADRAVQALAQRWLAACAYTGLGRTVSTAAGPTIGMRPQPIEVSPPGFSDRPRILVQLQPGQIVADLEDRREELARALGCYALRFEDLGGDYVTVHLVLSDPLSAVVPFLPAAPPGHLVLGRADDGRIVSMSMDAMTHMGIAGSTGAGKSGQLYSLLIQWAGMSRVDVAGIDPTGLLWRPWPAHPLGWRIGGTQDAAERYPALLRELVDVMDQRIARIPDRCDALPITEHDPLIVIVLEEMSGISRLTGFRASGAPSEAQRYVARLASESRKAGMRLVVVGQQLGSKTLDTDVRDQLNTRMSFGCRDLGTLRMLSPEATPEDLAPLAQSLAGVCLLDMAGESLTRMRAPWVGDSGAYWDHISVRRPRPWVSAAA